MKRVIKNDETGLVKLFHGRTIHGAQFIDPEMHNEPLAYYHKRGPMGDIFSMIQQTKRMENVGVIGLGAGSVASYAALNQNFDFFEIDQGVIEIARDLDFFNYLESSMGNIRIVLGDGRLELGREKDKKYQLILLDAFSSDSIPVHLLTLEALELYLKKLDSQGLLVFHISNRFLNLEPLLAGIAHKTGLLCFANDGLGNSLGKKESIYPSYYDVMGRLGTIVEKFSNLSS